MNARRPTLLLCLALAAGPALAAEPAPEQRLVIGLIPELNVFKQKARFRLLGDYLSRKVGARVGFTVLSRYGNVVDNFASEGMDGAFFGSFTGALAIERLGVVPLARPVNLDGSSTYHGYVFVRRDSGIRGVEDLRGKRMAFVDRATTAGYLFPLAWLRQEGVARPDAFFSEQYFTGSHDAAIAAVLAREADVGAAKHSVYDRVRVENPRLDEQLLILADSPRVPSNGLCVRADLDASMQRRLRQALLRLHLEPEGAAVLRQIGALQYIATSVEDYRPVLELARKAGIDLKQYAYRND